MLLLLTILHPLVDACSVTVLVAGGLCGRERLSIMHWCLHCSVPSVFGLILTREIGTIEDASRRKELEELKQAIELREKLNQR